MVEGGTYDPFRIDQADIAGLMISNGIVSEDDAYLHNFNEQDEKRLAVELEDNWDVLDDYSKVVYHVIWNTANLPRWRKPYPLTQEFLEGLKGFLSKDPRSAKI
ncbi:MAG: hypothetical protein GEU26_08705 [Nitrososphaeraceae archaeon]|nr:hypothetical protein [Nitrososphaeraceae archaeon]